jgi:hypothetical protein
VKFQSSKAIAATKALLHRVIVAIGPVQRGLSSHENRAVAVKTSSTFREG